MPPGFRKTISKKVRAEILTKTNGRCGYCGIPLEKKWHIDHMKPKYDYGKDDKENLMAACVQCNLYKSVLDVEGFRDQVERQIDMLKQYSVNYRTALRFRLLEPTPRKIVFYFETI